MPLVQARPPFRLEHIMRKFAAPTLRDPPGSAHELLWYYLDCNHMDIGPNLIKCFCQPLEAARRAGTDITLAIETAAGYVDVPLRKVDTAGWSEPAAHRSFMVGQCEECYRVYWYQLPKSPTRCTPPPG